MVGLIAIILLALGGISKAFMDLCSVGMLPWKGYYWSKSESWRSKWETHNHMPVLSIKGDNWWYLGIIKLQYKEKYPFSSTILVFATDFWHLSQFFFLKFIIVGAYLAEPITGYQIVDLSILYVSMLIPFELTHNFIKNKSK
tara:strand:+ start:303 stop:728 length:426 start_codon:yes stop_codon:yes gene_type:complete